MVKFQERKMKKTYKKKEYICKKYQIEFPVKANPKIEPHKGKNFDDIDFTSKDTPEQEVLTIMLIRNKRLEKLNKK